MSRTKHVNIHKAKTELSKLIGDVLSGEEVVIAKAGKPVAKLVPFRTKKKIRVPGSAKGEVVIERNFNAPLPAKVLKTFEQ
ncbi:MAG TPA: type II toxin-antitoxin system Phd/YefM family antitoxin [Acidobacteriota bacterium]|jgi:prevent-host-death family protein|nr:type II toxin-antitoxin system Phd/YefM family antitoxin [Acidobacteriota bacterium]